MKTTNGVWILLNSNGL